MASRTIATSIRAAIALLSAAIAAESAPPAYVDRWGNSHVRSPDGRFAASPSKAVAAEIGRVRDMVGRGMPPQAIAAELGVDSDEGMAAVRAAVAVAAASDASEKIRKAVAEPHARMVAVNLSNDPDIQKRLAGAFDRGYSSPAILSDAIAAAGVGAAAAAGLGKMGIDAHSRAMADLRKDRDDDVAELAGKAAAATVDTAIFVALFVGAPQIASIVRGKEMLAVLTTMTGVKVSRDTAVKATVELAKSLTPEQQKALTEYGEEVLAECAGFLSGAIVASMLRRSELMEGAAREAYDAIERAIVRDVKSPEDLKRISDIVARHYKDLEPTDRLLLASFTPFLKEELAGSTRAAIADALGFGH